MTSLDATTVSVSLGGHRILSEVDCRVRDGEVLAILGPNGAGKTTLVKALAGLLPIDGGAVRLGERPLTELGPRERAKSIAYLAQNGTIAWPLSVKAVVGLGRLPHGAIPDRLSGADNDAVERAITAADLTGFEARAATTLSGGERARVLLARAFAVEAPILLCDEPVAALDPRHQLAVMGGLKQEAARGRAVAVVMHDLALAARFADRVIILSGGRKIAEGPPRAALSADGIAAAFGIEALTEERADGLLVLPWRLKD
jgi:iron complex transport system ATP-binding protein